MPGVRYAGSNFEEAAGGNQTLKQVLAGHDRDMEELFKLVGRERGAGVPVGNIGAPPLATWSVTVVDGKIVVDIVNPASLGKVDAGGSSNAAQFKSIKHMKRVQGRETDPRPALRTIAQGNAVQHEIQSSLDLNFDSTSALKTYGPSADTHWVIDGVVNERRYWRFRSKFPTSDYNAWQMWQDPSACGATLLDSGLVRNSSLAFVATAYTPTGANPLTQSGVTTAINVAASTWKGGTNVTVDYGSGSVDPGSFGTYYVYARDPHKAGGAVTYIATTLVQDVTTYDDVIYFGVITTSGGGGGTGLGGGGGPCVVAGVLIELPDGTEKPAEEFRRGDEVRNISGGIDTLTQDPEIAGAVPCFEFTFENGIVLRGCSSRHTLQFDGGGFEFAFDLHEGDRLRTRTGPSVITLKRYIGDFTVYKFHLDNDKTYWTDKVASHNVSGDTK
jgi:hypothetical protein